MKGHCPRALNEAGGDSFISWNIFILGNMLLSGRQRLQALCSYIFWHFFIAFAVLMSIYASVNCAVAETCIVIRRTPSEVVVGADSKAVTYVFGTDSDGKKQKIKSEGTKCKIKQAGDTFYAISGVNLPDMDNRADVSCRGGKHYVEKAAWFKASISEPLTIALEQTRQENPDFYQQKFIGKPCLQIVFFGIEAGVPAYRVIEFNAINSLSEPVHITHIEVSCPGTFPATQSKTTIIGRHAAIMALNPTEDFWNSCDTIAGIKKLISIESKAMPEEVGGEIDIIRVTKDGAKWVEKKTECSDIQNITKDKPNSLSREKNRR